MILGDLLDAPVFDGDAQVGFVIDVRLVLDGPVEGLVATPRVHGLLVSPRTGTSFAGYERTGVNRPALVARWLAWRHRGTFLVLWTDVEQAMAGGRGRAARVDLRPGSRRWSPALR